MRLVRSQLPPRHNIARMGKLGVLAYGISLLAGLLLGFAVGYPTDTFVSDIPRDIWILAMATSALIVYGVSKWYFFDPRVVPSVREGALFGSVLVGISFIIDLLLVLPLWLSGSEGMYSFYTQPLFFVTLLGAIGVAALVGFEETYIRRVATHGA